MQDELMAKIQEAKEKFGDSAKEIIARDLQIENWNGEKGCCFNHSEKTPSLMWNQDNQHFHCFGCGINYGILDHYMQHNRMNYKDAVNKLLTDVDMGIESFVKEIKYDESFFRNYKYPKKEINTDRAKAESYCAKRKISPETLDYAGIKQDKYGNIVFEHYDMSGTLLATKYRPSQPVKKGQAKMWWQKDSSTCPILYGVEKIDISLPLLVVEGHMDRLACTEAGYKNVVSIPHGAEDLSWIEFNWEWLENFNEIIIWSDNDKVGKKMLKECVPRLGKHRCKFVGEDNAILDQIDVAFEGRLLKDNKMDANNVLIACGKEAVMSLVSNAEEYPNEKLKFLMDCEEIDIQNIEKTSTGYKNLDKITHGSLLGTFTIVTGYTGEGKSTFANQSSLIAPVENGYKAMVFSGELSNGQLKSWIMKPLAGQGHIIEWVNEGQPNGYTVTAQAKKVINSFYREKIVYYDDEDDYDTSDSSILEEMEYAYKKYGTKFFLIDNLMTIATSETDSVWDSQKKFIKKMMRFTNKFNVNTTLIVHPKKPSKGTTQNSYDLHGASEIANLCHRLYWFKRLHDDEEGFDAEVKVVKDRPTGMAGKSAKLYYDKKTMRLYSDKEEFNRVCTWEETCKINYTDDTKNRLACNAKPERHEIFD